MSGVDVDEVRYPHVVVEIPDSGPDANAFGIMARVRKALRRAGVSQEEIDTYVNEAKAGDYDHLLNVTERWITAE